MNYKKAIIVGVCVELVGVALISARAFSQSSQPAFKIAGKTVTVGDASKADQAAFYDLEKKKYELIDRMAKQQYLDHFWAKRAKASGKSVEAEKTAYEKKNVKVSDSKVEETLNKFKDHPSLKKLEKKEQIKRIREYLVGQERQTVYDGIIQAGIKKGELVISYPKPTEPIYNVNVRVDDHVRFGPKASDTKPSRCKGNDCAITVVEYSEFQCPFCEKVLPAIDRVLTEYKGRIRWIMRDFPLSFHDRARPAAEAAHCAGKQGKYWAMYHELFKNQSKLGDADFQKYAKNIGLDAKKFTTCVKSNEMANVVQRNFESGTTLGVSGTPAFFINGRRLSGAIPYEEFKRVIDEELRGKRKT